MKVVEILQYCMAAEIVVTTVEHLEFYSLDGGNTFHDSILGSLACTNPKDIYNTVMSRNVIKLCPRSEYRIEIYTD